MKTIIALWHSSNNEKKSSLRELTRIILNNLQNEITFPFEEFAQLKESEDFRFIFKYKDKLVAIETQGDPSTDLDYRLEDLANKGCEIIFCTTRTKGETIDAVDNLWSDFGYRTIWTSTYQLASKTDQIKFNQMKGKHLLEILNNLYE